MDDKSQTGAAQDNGLRNQRTRRDVSEIELLSVGRVRLRAVWSQSRAVCVSKAGVERELAGQASLSYAAARMHF